MWLLLAIVSALTFAIVSFAMKYGTYKNWSQPFLLLGLYISGTCGFFITTLAEKQIEFSIPLLVSGIVVGIGSTFGNIFFMKALNNGPASLTSPLVNANIILIVIMSVFFYGESLTITEFIGIALIIIAVMILPIDPQEKISIKNKVWYVYVLSATILFFFRNGGLKITEELNYNNTNILFFAYLIGVFWFTGNIIFKKGQLKNKTSCLHGLYCGLIGGIFSFLGIHFYTLALIEGPASIVSPLFASHSLIVVLLSTVLLKERLSLFQWFTLFGVIIGIIFIRI
jgi:drug/metabolite transporter (DMT)-like permease